MGAFLLLDEHGFEFKRSVSRASLKYPSVGGRDEVPTRLWSASCLPAGVPKWGVGGPALRLAFPWGIPLRWISVVFNAHTSTGS